MKEGAAVLITFDEASSVPIYQQIVDHIHRQIRSGALAAGFQLPTVRSLSEQTGIARGTVKHAYDTLEQLGLIRKIQGRGTFVNDLNQAVSKKEQAMAAIDQLLERLDELAFSPQEIRIFLDLKLRAREQTIKNVRVGAIDCSPEALSIISLQLSELPHVDLYEFLLDAVLSGQQSFDPDVDLLITTASHFQELKALLPHNHKLIQMVLSVSPQTAAELARIPARANVGILCASQRFSELITNACKKYCVLDQAPQISFFGDDGLDRFLSACDWLILPPNHLRFSSTLEASHLQSFNRSGKILSFHYQIEQGSMLYVSDRIETIYRTEKIRL